MEIKILLCTGDRPVSDKHIFCALYEITAMLGNIKHFNTLEELGAREISGKQCAVRRAKLLKTIIIPPTVANVCGMLLFSRNAITVSSRDPNNPGIYV